MSVCTRRAAQWSVLALGAALTCACGSHPESPAGGGGSVSEQPASRGGSGGVAAPSTPDAGGSPSTPGDAGPYQNYPIFDGSTTPTANHAHGVDAAAAEDDRGFADPPDAGPDAQ